MNLTRRDLIKLFGVTFASALVHHPVFGSSPIKIRPRIPLDEFAQSSSMMESLRRGYSEMKKRKPSDPLSFEYQAAIHGVPDYMINEFTKKDPAVAQLDIKKYWNQCPHFDQNSANFLPWHRGYTYHFERILRLHTGDPEFSLPYWNYMDEKQRKFPKEFGIQHLNADVKDDRPDNINPLFIAERDFYFAGYEHGLIDIKDMPLLQLSAEAVRTDILMSCPVFFGEKENEGVGGSILDEDASTRGLLESCPHDHIHRCVGGVVPSSADCKWECTVHAQSECDCNLQSKDLVGFMASPPTAGFDPIFSIHHATIDMLWAKWSCLPGKTWGKLPATSWFDERPWFFFAEDGREVNETRRNYFDHRKLGITFKGEDMSCKPLELPAMPELFAAATVPNISVESMAKMVESVKIIPIRRSVIPIIPTAVEKISAKTNAFRNGSPTLRSAQRVVVRFRAVNIDQQQATSFQIYLTDKNAKALTKQDRSFIGTISLFNHDHTNSNNHSGHHGNMEEAKKGIIQTFDITQAMQAIGNPETMELVVVPVSLLSSTVTNTNVLIKNVPLEISDIEFLTLSRG